MQIHGLKFMSDKGWNAPSVFTPDNGKPINVPANQKIICLDEKGDVVNLTLQVEVPVQFKPNEVLKPITLTGSVSHTSFGWSIKGTF